MAYDMIQCISKEAKERFLTWFNRIESIIRFPPFYMEETYYNYYVCPFHEDKVIVGLSFWLEEWAMLVSPITIFL